MYSSFYDCEKEQEAVFFRDYLHFVRNVVGILATVTIGPVLSLPDALDNCGFGGSGESRRL